MSQRKWCSRMKNRTKQVVHRRWRPPPLWNESDRKWDEKNWSRLKLIYWIEGMWRSNYNNNGIHFVLSFVPFIESDRIFLFYQAKEATNADEEKLKVIDRFIRRKSIRKSMRNNLWIEIETVCTANSSHLQSNWAEKGENERAKEKKRMEK